MLKILLTLLVPLCAATTFSKKVNVDELQKELLAAGLPVSGISCRHPNTDAMKCRVNWSRELDAAEVAAAQGVVQAHAYTDPFEPGRQRRLRMKALAVKLKAGQATQADKDELLLLLAWTLGL